MYIYVSEWKELKIVHFGHCEGDGPQISKKYNEQLFSSEMDKLILQDKLYF